MKKDYKKVVLNGSKKITKSNVHDVASKYNHIVRKARLAKLGLDLISNIKVLASMIKDYAKGNYKRVPWDTIVAVTFALIYFLTPVDLIPDVIPFLGYVDDIGVLKFVLSRFSKEIEEYKRWKESNSSVNFA
ncbi:YkvA family protein [Fervidobacterium sp.]